LIINDQCYFRLHKFGLVGWLDGRLNSWMVELVRVVN